MKLLSMACLVGLLTCCDGTHPEGSSKRRADSIAVVDSARLEGASASSQEDAGSTEMDEATFLRTLEQVMAPAKDSLEREFVRIRGLADSARRDSAILALSNDWGKVREAPLQVLLDQSIFLRNMWIDSLGGPDTGFKNRVCRILASAGKYLDYNEGFSTEADLGGRPDLLESTATRALRERLRMEHVESATLTYNDAGIVAPLDTLVGRIQGWEAFARRHPGTEPAKWAESVSGGYLSSLLCGLPNSRPIENGKPAAEFLAAWQKLASGPDGPARRFVREWLGVLQAEGGNFTPKAKAWLEERGYSPEEALE